MQTVRSVDEMQAAALAFRGEGKTIGLVPTMGFLHEGHLRLIDMARADCDVVIVSIFVNPTQFGVGEDFDKYPRDLDKDLDLCEKRNADIVFLPSIDDMFPAGYSTFVEETQIAKGLCGLSRPLHFRGVTTVCLKLFALCQPNVAVFGQKDAQQSKVICRMVSNFHLPIEIKIGETVRETDGLALSSRNVYLDEEQRSDALSLYQALQAGKNLVDEGTRNADRVRAELVHVLSKGRRVRVIYADVVDRETMEPLRSEIVPGSALLVVAAWVDSVRLIDNHLL